LRGTDGDGGGRGDDPGHGGRGGGAHAAVPGAAAAPGRGGGGGGGGGAGLGGRGGGGAPRRDRQGGGGGAGAGAGAGRGRRALRCAVGGQAQLRAPPRAAAAEGGRARRRAREAVQALRRTHPEGVAGGVPRWWWWCQGRRGCCRGRPRGGRGRGEAESGAGGRRGNRDRPWKQGWIGIGTHVRLVAASCCFSRYYYAFLIHPSISNSPANLGQLSLQNFLLRKKKFNSC